MLMRLSYPLPSIVETVVQASPNWAGVGVRAGLRKYSIFTFPVGEWLGGWVGVEIEVNVNSAPNWVGVGAELGKKKN